MGVKRGGEKARFHIKDKFLTMQKEAKMGSWGITMRQSGYGLDLLGTIMDAVEIGKFLHC